jgi:hypothetical protein
MSKTMDHISAKFGTVGADNKQVVNKSDRLPLFSAALENVWNYASIPSCSS